MDLTTMIENQATFNGFQAAIDNSYTPSVTSATSACVTTGGYWPSGTDYWHTWPCGSDNKTEKAYGVIRALMRAKVIRVQSLDKFFSLMDEVVKVL